MSSTSDKKAKFFFANCLHCDGIIRIPIAIRPSSDVACPHCANRSKLFDLMDQIPEGEVVDGQGNPASASAEVHALELTEPTTQQQDGKFVVPPQLAAGIKKRRRRRRRSSSSESGEESGRSSSSAGNPLPSNQTSSQTPSIQTSTTTKNLSEAEENRQARKEEQAQRRREEFRQKREATAARARVAAAPARPKTSRPAKVKRSPVMEAIKIIIGGMFAAPIAYLLLLWVFSRDPLSLAPTIHSFAPAFVPEWVLADDEPIELESPSAERTFVEQGDGEEVDDFFKNLDSGTEPSDSDLGGGLDDGIDFDETVFD